jgi:uncharacterized protein YkwD
MLLSASKSLLALLLVSAAPYSGSGDSATALPSEMLALHNRERALVGVPPLSWSDRLAAEATAYAAHLVRIGDLEHSSDEARGDEGENLAMGTAGYYSPVALGRMWADEKRAFAGGAFDDGGDDAEAVGHYTQMVWRTTRQVGCGVAEGGGDTYLICRYAPAGNYVGERVY